ncbi:hypothetical protein TNCT_49941 [Trichonephila clavata]|uniref:Uncharacterized protein n=1 Tax=Trichonephila clavata TaxID=2740835 RepID=A0A8X6I879_TRICU|nr:hypothetical protein TNCT_49941 [Trichonephila clavata]
MAGRTENYRQDDAFDAKRLVLMHNHGNRYPEQLLGKQHAGSAQHVSVRHDAVARGFFSSKKGKKETGKRENVLK